MSVITRRTQRRAAIILEWNNFLRILIVDDHEAVRKGVRAILRSRPDIEVCGEAVNGQEAVEKALELKPDLIILDITMPVLDGFGAAKEIRSRSSDVPILFYSMNDGKALMESAKAIGANGFVTKSEAAAVLLKAVGAISKKETFFPAL
jgi:two-component system, NarL family, nitrate/nitrite response regulator NarL